MIGDEGGPEDLSDLGHSAEAPTGLAVHAVIDRDDFRLDVEFTVAPGEILGVLGPNGAGKTTLLRALAGLASLSWGSIRLDGQILDDAATDRFLPAEQRPVGLLFQNYRLFPHLSVRGNVAFAPRSDGQGRRAARRLADDWLSRLGLSEFADRKPGQLSGGQAQRVALARALASNPGMLLLDEPLAALDARTKLEVRAELRRHLKAFDGPTLIVTHDPLEAMVMTDRLLVLEEGRIVQQGTPAEVGRRPATQYVARLVGLNLYPGALGATVSAADQTSIRVTIDGGGVLVAAGGVMVAAGGVLVAAGGARVLAAIRPTAIALHTSPPVNSSARNIWPGTVSGLELLADRVRIQVAGSPSALVDVTADAVADLDLAEGTPVWLAVKAGEVDVYPDPNYPGAAA